MIKNIETNPIDLNMLKIDNVDAYTCLTIPIFVLETIQKTTIVGRVTITLIVSWPRIFWDTLGNVMS